MRWTRSLRAGTGAAVAAAMGAYGYDRVVRPRLLAWGTSAEERRRTLPGDDLVPCPKQVSDRAVTIDAPASDVWPWLAQIGQGRGGFYSYDCLENLVGADIHSASTVLPQFQQVTPGDRIYIGRNGPFYSVADVQPERYLLLQADAPHGEQPPIDESWLFYVEDTSAGQARLLARNRRSYPDRVSDMLMWRVLIEPLHHVMERRMLLGLKKRAEGATQ